MQRWIKLPDGRFIDANRIAIVGRPQSFAHYEDGSDDMTTAYSVQVGIDYSRENQITVVGSRDEVLAVLRNLLAGKSPVSGAESATGKALDDAP